MTQVPNGGLEEQNVISNAEQQSDSETKFAKQVESLIDNFGKQFEDNQVAEAIVIAKIPGMDSPLVFIRGDILPVGEMIAAVLRGIKHDVNRMLDA